MLKLFKIYVKEFKEDKILYFFNNFFFKLLNLILTLIIINKTSEIHYGQYVYFISLISIVLTLSCSGLTLTLIKDIASKNNKISNHNYLSSLIIFSFIFPLILGLILFLLLFIILNLENLEEFRSYFLLYLIQLIILNILVSFNIALDKQVRSQLTETFIRLPLIILFFLIIEELSLDLLLISINIGLFVSIFILFYLSFSNLKLFFDNFFYFSIKSMKFKQVFIIGLTAIISGLYARTDILMIEHLAGLPQVSIYSFAFIIGHIPLLVITSLNPFIQTIASRENTNKIFKNTKTILFFSRFTMLVFSIFFFLFYIFFFKKIINSFVSTFYQESLIISIYFLLYFIVISLFYFGEIILTMTNNIYFIFKCYFFCFILNFIFNYFFILKYQAKGAIFATILTLFISNMLMFMKSRSVINK